MMEVKVELGNICVIRKQNSVKIYDEGGLSESA
jgi:hypothetical protein